MRERPSDVKGHFLSQFRSLVASRVPVIRDLRELPKPERHDDWLGAESAGVVPESTK